MTISEEKKLIRRLIKELHLKHDNKYKNEASEIIFKKIENSTFFQKARYILLYWSDENEVNTHQFIEKWYKIKNIYLPYIKNERDLEFRLFEGKEKLTTSEKFKILEPTSKKIIDQDNIDVAIIPGVAFDIEKNRMGRGKGYYDKFLKDKKFLKVGICFDYQLLNKIPVGVNDIKMDEIISEKRWIR